MRLERVSRGEVDRVKAGDWVRVKFGEGDDAVFVEGRVMVGESSSGSGAEIVQIKTRHLDGVYLRINDSLYPSAIVEHRPVAVVAK